MPTTPKVLFCIYTHNIWGGIEYWLVGLARHLQSRGWHIRLGLARGYRHNDPDAFAAAHPGLHILEFDGRTGTQRGRIQSIVEVVRRERPDVVMPLGLGDVFHAIASVKHRGQEIRVIAPIRSTSAQQMAEVIAFAPVIDCCIGNNPLHAQFLKAEGCFPPERLHTIINGVPIWREAKRGIASASDPIRLLFVGRLNQLHKRVGDLPAVLYALRAMDVPFRLTVVGDGEGRDELERHCKAELTKGTVQLVGHVEQSELLSNIYSTNDVLLHFSASEGCPQSVQQAMSRGVVPVCSEFLGIHSLGFLRHNETCCTFPVGHMDQAAQHVRRLFGDRLRLAQLSKAAIAAMDDFDVRKVMQQWEARLVSVMDIPARVTTLDHLPLVSYEEGRLTYFNLPPIVADRMRRLIRRFPEFSDGWGEWPGTVSAPTEEMQAAITAKLGLLDRSMLIRPN